MLSLEAIVYTASALDTEGCIRIGRDNVNRRHFPSYRGIVFIGQTNHTWLEWFKQVWGGRVEPQRRKRKSHAQSWVWVVSGKELVHLLQCTLPYFKLKHAQAELVLELSIRVAKGEGRPRGRGRYLPMASEERVFRHALYERCKALNKKGPKAEQVPLLPVRGG